jgi:hypothetical protein
MTDVLSLYNRTIFRSIAYLTRAISSGLLAYRIGSSLTTYGSGSDLLSGDAGVCNPDCPMRPNALTLSLITGTLRIGSYWTGVTLLHTVKAVIMSLAI